MSRLVFGLLAIATLLVFGFCQECNICNAENGVACVSNTAFKMCDDSNSPNGDLYNCPTDSKCTGSRRICETGVTLKGACESCDICSRDAVFKCTSRNQFALCVDPDSTIKYECAGSYVC
ncbi:CG32024, partial [Drosophila busckii]